MIILLNVFAKGIFISCRSSHIIIGIALTIIFNLYVEKQKQTNTTDSNYASVESEQQSNENDKLFEEKDTYVPKGILTLESYLKLQEEISYEETVKILGSKGRKESVRETPDSHSVTYIFPDGSSVTNNPFSAITETPIFCNCSITFSLAS